MKIFRGLRHPGIAPGCALTIVRFNTKRLPLLQNQKATDPRDYLFTAIAIRINNAVKLNLFPDNRQ